MNAIALELVFETVVILQGVRNYIQIQIEVIIYFYVFNLNFLLPLQITIKKNTMKQRQ